MPADAKFIGFRMPQIPWWQLARTFRHLKAMIFRFPSSSATPTLPKVPHLGGVPGPKDAEPHGSVRGGRPRGHPLALGQPLRHVAQLFDLDSV